MYIPYKKATTNFIPIMLTILVCAAFWNVLQPLPEVWLGDRTNSCIIIKMPDGTEVECPEDKSELPDKYIPVYVFEDL